MSVQVRLPVQSSTNSHDTIDKFTEFITNSKFKTLDDYQRFSVTNVDIDISPYHGSPTDGFYFRFNRTYVDIGDYIVKDLDNEFYAYSEEDFHKIYEEI